MSRTHDGPRHLHPQHLNTGRLILGNLTGAAAGLLFWLAVVRLARLEPAHVGLGYATVATATAVAVVAKGGFDTALLRTLPDARAADRRRLVLVALASGGLLALAVSAGLAAAAGALRILRELDATDWTLAAIVAVLLVVGWLQDAYWLGVQDARPILRRNLVLGGARLAFILPLALVAVARPIPAAWALALAASSLSVVLPPRRPVPAGARHVRVRELFSSAARNVTGSAAEFLPGIALVPLVLAVAGPEAAAYFGIAWAIASLLFIGSAAISRSTLKELVREPTTAWATPLRRAVQEHLWLLAPAALAGALLAPLLLTVFGPDYARAATPTLILLCASLAVVAPAYLYLAVLRARQRTHELWALPVAMLAALLLLAPPLADRLGILGVSIAWVAANAPFGLYAAWRLRPRVQEVSRLGSVPLDRGHHVE